MAELQILGFRNLVCGMHVHVEVPDDDLRLDVMRRAIPFLPILLALSTSSPFWRGMNTGFSSYRLTSYDELPRTGPAAAVLRLAAISRLYRGAARSRRDPGRKLHLVGHPPVPQVPDAGAAHPRCLHLAGGCHHRCRPLSLSRVRADGRSHDQQRHQFAEPGAGKENKWRVQRFGLRAELIDPFREHPAIDAAAAARRLVQMLRRYASALDCLGEIEHVETISDARHQRRPPARHL